MNQSLTYLMDELCAGVEIYYTGRTGGQYLKTAFILCDDYSELVAKLFLLMDNSSWTDKKSDGHYKNYHNVMTDLEAVINTKMPTEQARVTQLLLSMSNRRKRRNDFFHSTSLLDLNVTQRNCVEAFCELLELGQTLFGTDWRQTLDAARNMATFELLLRIELLALSDPSIQPKVNRLLQEWPRNISNSCRKGVHLTEFPEDLHLRLCITCGGKELRDKLRVLLTP